MTAVIADDRGNREQAFIAVDGISSGVIHGRIWNHMQLLEGRKFQDPYSLPESDILDWLITKPDGTEEGNFVGKFMNTLPREMH